MSANARVTLVICDGMGLTGESRGNAILQARTPTFDYLLTNYPAIRLLAAGTEVGLDIGEPGNSEVGHLTLGTGQVLPQAFQIINGSIKSEAYKQNKMLLLAFQRVRHQPSSTLHIAGLISQGGIHGHVDHLLAILRFAKESGVERVAVHAFTDGRDSPPRVALDQLKPIQNQLKQFKFGVIASISGRFYAMDRDSHWDRTDAAYWAMLGKSKYLSQDPEQAIQEAYARQESDENLQPTLITDSLGAPLAFIKPGDVVLFTNYRPDRIRQLASRTIMTGLELTIVTMTDYFLGEIPQASARTRTTVLNAYPLPKPSGTLATVLAKHAISQLHIAESEKYAHITYFFNGHQEVKKPDEQWLLVPSVTVNSFDQAPQMSAGAIVSSYVDATTHHPYKFTAINFANMDMVGHTGNLEATVQAVEGVDTQLKTIVDLCENRDEWLLITADHGNAEQMIDLTTGQPDKEHTTNPVPFILVHPSYKKARMLDKHQLAMMSNVALLADVAPTILDIFDIAQPREMVGSSLLPQMGLV